jgi:tripartite ATP-independent transporter DctP family solute receptor
MSRFQTTQLATACLCAFVAAGVLMPADVDAQTYTARIGHLENTDQPRHIALEIIAERVAERTDNDLELQIFPSSQLGGQREMNEGVQLGTLEGTVSATSWMGGFNPYVTILDLPYFLPTDTEQAQELRSGPFGDRLLETFNDAGFHAISFWPFGFKQITSNRPLDSIEDIAGQRFRVMASDILIAQFEALGASAISLPFGELYTALQNRVVDGQENPVTSILSMRFYEVQDHILISDHGAIEDVVVFNPAWWASLPEDYQDIIVDAFAEVVPELQELYRVQREAGIKHIEESGTNVRHLSAEEMAALRDKAFEPTRTLYLEKTGDTGAELMELYEAEYARITGN